MLKSCETIPWNLNRMKAEYNHLSSSKTLVQILSRKSKNNNFTLGKSTTKVGSVEI